ncbi:T9SS type A sorting domain-containing protein [Adhaeribacter soli]|uniref:T9SS type A sorting domain-containing protein n=1 Tax=Adhaeribacter soli TaxID=2607655 RepID=A0A5N1J3Z9_9BACT|nr:T9SS type A sorting domain-containing protein [Adhaeribacter soli]KAA9345626.1 T9SS type A sorting domain-containing protein [Adhaeribacter soli]
MLNKNLSRTLLVALGLSCSLSVSARENLDKGSQAGGNKPGKGNKVAAGCLNSSSQAVLDINNVRTTVLNGGDMWWNLFDARYEVPKVNDPALPKKHSIFAGSVWLGGRDAQDNLYVAAQTYRQRQQVGYWPGPLDLAAGGTISKEDCATWNYHAKIDQAVIEKFKTDFRNGVFQGKIELMPKAIKEWPAKNNQHMPVRTNMNFDLAPFEDINGDGDYNPLDGDYPKFTGDQGIWWVMNDAGNVKEPFTKPIGLELQVLAFAFQTNDLINNMTFYKQKLTNKGSVELKDTYMGQWVDPDLGFYNDDFVGCDVGRGLGICYNGDNDDEGANGYGLNPPAVGVDFFQGPIADPGDGIDNDRDGTIDEAGETIIMSSFIYYNNDANATNGNPDKASDYYNYLQAIWRDGKIITHGGDGTDQGGTPYKFMFSGSTDPKGYGFSTPANPIPNTPPSFAWTETNTVAGTKKSNTPADRRFLQSAGPFTLGKGAVNELTIGVVWARSNGGGATGSFGLLTYADDRAQKLFDNDFVLPQGPDAPELAITELDQQLILTLIPKKIILANGNTVSSEQYVEEDKSLASNPHVADPFYRFEGYKVYQLKDATVSASEVDDIDRARLVAQADIKNGVTNIVNFVYDADLDRTVPKLRVRGEDKGLSHTINVTTDLFATGNDRIINFKSYHYLVVAYAYNGDPANTDDKYLEGRRVSLGTGIPHKTQPENSGTVLTAAYGASPEIIRIFGTGNGGNILEISSQDEQDILASNQKQLLHYQPGNSPFKVKVYDPKIITGGEFTVKLSSRISYKASTVTSTSRKLKKGDLIESTGDFTKPAPYNTAEFKKAVSAPTQIPGKAIVRRVLPPVILRDTANGGSVDTLFTVDVEMLNDHLNGRFTAEVDLTKLGPLTGTPPRPSEDPIGYDEEPRTFRVASGSGNDFAATANLYVPNDFWAITLPGLNAPVYGERPISEFNEQILVNPETNKPMGLALEFSQANNPGYHILNSPLNGSLPSSVVYSGNKWFEGVKEVPNPADPQKPYQWLLPKSTFGFTSEVDEVDPNYNYYEVNNGSWAPLAVTQIVSKGGPNFNLINVTQRKIFNLPNVDVVITSDKSKWTRVAVLQGTASKSNFALSKDDTEVYSVDKDGNEDNTMSDYDPSKRSVGMGWFPGYAIDLDRGVRLNMMFAEFGLVAGDKTNKQDPGRNLKWDPTADAAKSYGKEFIYVTNTVYDEGKQLGYLLDSLKATVTRDAFYQNFLANNIFNKVTWVGYPRLAKGQQLLSGDVRVKLRVSRQFTSFNMDGKYNVNPVYNASGVLTGSTLVPYTGVNTNPEYLFNTNGLLPRVAQQNTAKDALAMIRVVPNPYYASSQYEQRQLDNIVKITNLPRKCKVSIYTINGTLIRTFNKDDSKTFLDWNLKNEFNLPISSGVYIVHVDAGNIGSKVVKWFGIMRPADLESF